MFKIAICNDAEEINSQIEAFIHAYSLDSYKVDVFSDSYSLIQSLKNNDHMLYFLNIEKDNQGIEVAKTVRKYNLNAFIVFLANHKKYMSEIFEIRTFDYVLKPVTKERIFRIMDDISRLLNLNKKQFVFSVNNMNNYISFGEIIYFEKHKRQTMLHHVSGMSKVFYMNTDQILEQLDACFTQIHTSFIININFVRQASRTKVILNNHRGIELPISRKYRENVSNKFVHLQK